MLLLQLNPDQSQKREREREREKACVGMWRRLGMGMIRIHSGQFSVRACMEKKKKKKKKI
jgi:hypothetical protein